MLVSYVYSEGGSLKKTFIWMDILLEYFSCVTIQFFQGLGLLINLVEYSARNRHCLVNMETSCSFDSFCTGEGDDSLKITGQIDAVQALVQVRNDPKMCFSCKQYSFLLSEIQGRRKNSAVKNFARILFCYAFWECKTA